MKKYTKNIGLILIVLGTLALIATRFSYFSTHNELLIMGLLCIVAGISVSRATVFIKIWSTLRYSHN